MYAGGIAAKDWLIDIDTAIAGRVNPNMDYNRG